MNVKLWEGQRNCVQCDASFLPLVPLVFMRATALPVALVVVWDMHLFSLLGRRQPDTGVPRQSDVSAGVLLPPLQCWQAYCKGIPEIHFSVSSHDTCMHYHGCHGYTLVGGVIVLQVCFSLPCQYVLSYWAGIQLLLPRQHLCTLTYVMDYLAVFPHYHCHHVHTVDQKIFTLKIIRVKIFLCCYIFVVHLIHKFFFVG